jgi:hypothetical protein
VAKRKCALPPEQGESVMTAIPFLQNSAFGPDEITATDEAFVNVCAALRISEREGGLTEQVALKVVELAKAGERDPTRLTCRVLEVFNAA